MIQILSIYVFIDKFRCLLAYKHVFFQTCLDEERKSSELDIEIRCIQEQVRAAEILETERKSQLSSLEEQLNCINLQTFQSTPLDPQRPG